MSLNPILLEVLWNRLLSVANEQQAHSGKNSCLKVARIGAMPSADGRTSSSKVRVSWPAMRASAR